MGYSLCICDGDIYKAYDETNHVRVCNALIGKQAPSGQLPRVCAISWNLVQLSVWTRKPKLGLFIARRVFFRGTLQPQLFLTPLWMMLQPRLLIILIRRGWVSKSTEISTSVSFSLPTITGSWPNNLRNSNRC